VLIDDTSRLGRKLVDVLTVVERFRFNGVFVYFVAQGLDSRDAGFRYGLILNGLKDEDFLVDLRNKVHRGLREAVLEGHHTGGTRYGYKSILVEDPIRKDKHGRPEVAYTYLAIDPEQASVVERIFEMRASGRLVTHIAKYLNGEGIAGPTGKKWSYATIRRLVRDELYIGIVNWNRTRNERDPAGRMRQRKRDPEEWVTVENPELRIVDKLTWDRVQTHNERMMRRGEKQRVGGYFRTQKNGAYLFSGLLLCGTCNRRLSIISSGKRWARYGCPANRSEGTCTNGLTIRRDALEEQLLSAISDKLVPEKLLAHLDLLEVEIQEYLDRAVSDEPSETVGLEQRLAEMNKKRSHITGAISSFGHSEGLFLELAEIENEIGEVKRKLSPRQSEIPRKHLTFADFRRFVVEVASNLKTALRSDPVVAREVLRQVISNLVLTPVETSDGAVYEVSGEHIDLLSGKSCVMHGQLVDRSAKHYTCLLSLLGVQLATEKPTQQTVTGSDDRSPSAFLPWSGVETASNVPESSAI